MLLATEGDHPFFESERGNIRKATTTPIKIGGYAISFVAGRACVRIERETFRLIKAEFLRAALVRSAESLEVALLSLPFVPYEPVRSQLFEIRRLVNQRRKLASLPLVAGSAIRWHRRIVRPFEPISEADVA